MEKDKFSATWVSHTSLSDFKKCPRCYYLKNVYKDPKTGHKIQVMSPPLALGQAVHSVIESLSILPVNKRFDIPLLEKYEQAWENVSGKKGGFRTSDSEYRYKERGAMMLRRVMTNPGPLARLAVKMAQELPFYWLSEQDNIILCGKVDWLEYLPETDTVHIIDFKTSKSEEDPSSFQLAIYGLLVKNCQKREVEKVSYWYLEMNDYLTPKDLPDLQASEKEILKVAKQIKLARQLDKLSCKDGGCFACRPYEAVLAGQAEYVGVSELRQDIYIAKESPSAPQDDSMIL